MKVTGGRSGGGLAACLPGEVPFSRTKDSSRRSSVDIESENVRKI